MTDHNTAESPVHALVEQREQLRGWISKLDEMSTGAPTRVAERIRQDYGDRLARVIAELGEHREEIGRDLDAVRAQLREAEERHAHSTDAMEEMRLRHMIGELGENEWETQRARLDEEVAATEAETRQLRGEVERLAALAADLSEQDADAAFASAGGAPADTTPAQEPVAGLEPTALPGGAAEEGFEDTSGWMNEISLDEPAGTTPPDTDPEEASGANWNPLANEFSGAPETPRSDVGSEIPWLETPERDGDSWTPAAGEGDGLEFLNDLGTPPADSAATSGLAEDDLAFLEELDRAISGSASRPSTPPPAATSGGDAPAVGSSGGPLLCKECGAINEPHSWYCEICGSEL